MDTVLSLDLVEIKCQLSRFEERRAPSRPIPYTHSYHLLDGIRSPMGSISAFVWRWHCRTIDK